MLVLGRKPGEEIILFDKYDNSIQEVIISLVSIDMSHGKYGSVKIGIDAADYIGIYRNELKRHVEGN